MIDRLFGIYWAAPSNSIFFVVIMVLILLLGMIVFNSKGFIARLAHPNHQNLLIKNFSWQRYVIKQLLMAVALVLIGIALMRPQWDVTDEKVMSQGRDLLVALDISRSMLAQDCNPNRLEYAKKKIKRLVDMLEADRVGLLVFSGAAVMQCPLTTDRQAFAMFLDTLSVETISSGTTSYRAALEKILELFSAFAPDRTKLAILCTDGEDFSQDLASVQIKLADQRVHVCTLSVATEEGAPIPLYNDAHVQQGFQKDAQGRLVVSRCNVALMQQIACDTKGIFVPATRDDADLNQIKKWVVGFAKTKWEERAVDRFQDKYFYYTGCAALLLLIGWLL